VKNLKGKPRMSPSIRTTDDYFHRPEKETDWRESYYFNFVNQDNKTSGFTTIGILPNQKRGEFVLALIRENKQTLYYKEQELPVDYQVKNTLSDKTLTYSLVEPMDKWEIEFNGKDLNLQIQWKARFPPFDFGKGSKTSWKGHFEQSGIVRGEVALSDDGEIPIEGYSQRDKSWGPRNWHIENWFALHAQFQEYAIGLRRDVVNNTPHLSGGLSSAKQQTSASQIDLTIDYGKKGGKTPVGAVTKIGFADGRIMTLKSRLISPKSVIKFSRSFPMGLTELFEGMAIHECTTTGERGNGLIEFLLTHPKPS
jgi:hypothetical protein